ncbi:MAG: trimethylamine methyltransferase family protein [Albidovulum sp.]
MARYESAFYHPILTDTRNYATWADQGRDTAEIRANGIWKRMLAEYERPPIDDAVDEALRDFVARRKSEITARHAA